MNRKDAKPQVQLNTDKTKDEFDLFFSYINYMKDEEKQGNLFTAKNSHLSKEETKTMKNMFELSQENNSPMWQDVISFDNKWLEKNGIYDSKFHTVDESRMQEIVRESMYKMLENENMQDSAIWTASLHYNTDNIHVHIATVEPHPTREEKEVYDQQTGEYKREYKGSRKPQSLDKLKSHVVNKIMDRSNEHEKINQLIRGTVQNKKQRDTVLANNRHTKNLFMKAMEELPNDKRQWKYGYESINNARPYIDKITDLYLKQYHRREMKELQQTLDKEVEVMKETYGEGSQYKDYKQNKLDDLRRRMGNAVLTEMRNHAQHNEYHKYNIPSDKEKMNYRGKPSFKKSIVKDMNIKVVHLTHAMRKTFHDYQTEKQISEFDRMMDGYDM